MWRAPYMSVRRGRRQKAFGLANRGRCAFPRARHPCRLVHDDRAGIARSKERDARPLMRSAYFTASSLEMIRFLPDMAKVTLTLSPGL